MRIPFTLVILTHLFYFLYVLFCLIFLYLLTFHFISFYFILSYFILFYSITFLISLYKILYVNKFRFFIFRFILSYLPSNIFDLIIIRTSLDHHVAESRSEILRVQEVPFYDSSLYSSRRIHATSRDGMTHFKLKLMFNYHVIE